jgi:hypothetical protein
VRLGNRNGSEFLADKEIISHFLAHKKFVISFAPASGNTITDEYLTDGLSFVSLRTDCPAVFKRHKRLSPIRFDHWRAG